MKLAAPLLVIAVLAALALWGARQQAPQQTAQPVVCADPVAGCAFVHDGLPVQLRFSAPPSAMRPFTVALAAPGLRRASISFRMAGMDMGFNRYELLAGADGRRSASVTLPVCTVSRADWIAQLELDGRVYVLNFTVR